MKKNLAITLLISLSLIIRMHSSEETLRQTEIREFFPAKMFASERRRQFVQTLPDPMDHRIKENIKQSKERQKKARKGTRRKLQLLKPRPHRPEPCDMLATRIASMAITDGDQNE